MPMAESCAGFIPLDDDISANHHGGQKDCAECVYFSRRNCGKDTGGIDNMDVLFSQPFV